MPEDDDDRDQNGPIADRSKRNCPQYIQTKAEKIAGKTEEIDALINAHTKGWKTSRMNKVDLTILRLAVYEMKWDEDVPVGVAIDEAVELAKKYSGSDGPSFVNGVLAKLTE